MTIRDHILTVAGELFYRKGIRAVGIDLIIREANVAKATLYRHFPSRDQLVLDYLQSRHQRVIGALTGALAAPALPARQRVRQIFEILRDKADSEPFRGCAFLLAVAESEGSDGVLAIAQAHKRAFQDIFNSAARELTPDFALLGQEIALCYEGALASIALQRSGAPIDIALRCAEVLIEAAIQKALREGANV